VSARPTAALQACSGNSWSEASTFFNAVCRNRLESRPAAAYRLLILSLGQGMGRRIKVIGLILC